MDFKDQPTGGLQQLLLREGATFVNFLIQVAIAIVIALIAYALAPKPKAATPDMSRDLEAPTSEAGRPVNVIFGEGTVKSPNCLWSGNAQTRIQKVKM